MFSKMALGKKSFPRPYVFNHQRNWTPSQGRSKSGGTTFQGVNLTTKSEGNREQLSEANEKTTSQGNPHSNATAETRRSFTMAKKWRSFNFERFWHAY